MKLHTHALICLDLALESQGDQIRTPGEYSIKGRYYMSEVLFLFLVKWPI